jgi:hypothetical protein
MLLPSTYRNQRDKPGAATSGNFVGLLRSISAVQLDRHPPFHSRPGLPGTEVSTPMYETVSKKSFTACEPFHTTPTTAGVQSATPSYTGNRDMSQVTMKYAVDETALREAMPHGLISTNVKGVYAIPAPSDDFDLYKASISELLANGMHWRRPDADDHPSLHKVWRRMHARKWHAKDRIIPRLAPQIGKTHTLRQPLKRLSDQSFLNPAWAGAGIRGEAWTGVIGFWTIPTVSKPSEPQGTEGGWNSSSWLGIDGFGISNDVLQAGIQQTVDAAGHAGYVAWFEWYAPPTSDSPPYVYQTNIENFPVSPGQNVFCYVVLFQNGFFPGIPLGIITFQNEATGQVAAATLLPPPGAAAQGNTVEWIMEAPDGGEPTSALPNFTPVQFTSALASNYDGSIVGNPENGDTINVETAGGQVLTSVAVGNETVTINFIG